MTGVRTKEGGEVELSDAIDERMRALGQEVSELICSPVIKFDEGCRSALPESPGIYRIFDLSKPDITIRAGRTKTAAGGLRQRVYQNHLMGNQAGNLRAQLVARGECADDEAAKRLIRERFGCQVLVVENAEERARLEHFMLAVLMPRYSD